jgi:hypothetical protein
MTIYFSSGMGIRTDTNFGIIGTDGSTVKANVDNASGMLEKTQPVWRCVYALSGGAGNQIVWAGGKLPFDTDYGGEGNHYNFNQYYFVCPVPGNYRMSMNVLHCGNAYANPNDHYYGYRNGTFISNGGHMVGSANLNYATTHWIGVINCSAGDYLWFGHDGGRLYSGGWCVATYQLLG